METLIEHSSRTAKIFALANFNHISHVGIEI